MVDGDICSQALGCPVGIACSRKGNVGPSSKVAGQRLKRVMTRDEIGIAGGEVQRAVTIKPQNCHRLKSLARTFYCEANTSQK